MKLFKESLLIVLAPALAYSLELPQMGFVQKTRDTGEKKDKEKQTLKVKLRLQPRLDFGDIYKKEGKFRQRSDFYLRRTRLEISKKWKNIPIGEKLKVKLVLSMDKGERNYSYKSGKKKYRRFDVELKYVYVDWELRDELALLFGRKKKPYSRIALTSSSRQLLIERPFFIGDAKDWVGEYAALQFMLHGKFLDGVLRYMFAVSDGSAIEEEQKAGDNAKSDTALGNFYAFRLELSPPGFVEKKKDDTGIGKKNKGNVISLGVSYARNRNFDVDTDDDTDNGYEVKNEKGSLWGIDLFGRFKLGSGVLSAQFEYASMEYEKTDRREYGWYAQAGYLLNTSYGGLEPAVRYEYQSITYKDRRRKVLTFGFNHYIKKHKLKWSYNILFINNDWSDADDQTVHQVQAQVYF